jgi:hypothetical protein
LSEQGNEKRLKEKDFIDAKDLVKGMIIGVAAALAIGGLIALLTTKRRSFRDSMRPRKRVETYAQDDEALGEVPGQFEESGGGIIDTIRSVNEALDTGRQAMETIQSVIENIRGS